MIGVVVVSHSAILAEGIVELARQVTNDKVRVAVAGGSSDTENPIGTDAFHVLAAIESVDSEDGVIVLMDLGSAMLSAETAIEFLEEPRRSRVRLCGGPLVEGTIAAVSLAAAGGTIDEIVVEAERALDSKKSQLGLSPLVRTAASLASEHSRQVTLRNRLGLHARPAARLVRLLRNFDARVTLENLSAHTGPFEASGLNGVLSLCARQGHLIVLRADGGQAREALAELAGFMESGCGDSESAESTPSLPRSPPEVTANDAIAGIGVSAGIAIGPLVRFHPIASEIPQRAVGDAECEWLRLQSALSAARDQTRTLYAWTRQRAGEDPAGIFDAQLLLLEDPELLALARRLVFEETRSAAFAWHSAASTLTEKLAAIDDPYLSARAADLSDVNARVLAMLLGTDSAALTLSRPSIVAAHDLLPSQIEKLNAELVLGLCFEAGSAVGHSSILARARGIPAVAALGPVLATVEEGTLVALDGDQGIFWVSPGKEIIQSLEERRRAWLDAQQTLRMDSRAPALTRDGHRITLLANLSSEAQTSQALDHGAEGVGVLRTEFLFLDRETAPNEDEQYTSYRNIAQSLAGRILVVRTLDIGGDKPVPYVDIGPEPNPFLGWRGMRVTLGRRDLFETQLRAILRAGYSQPVEILLPMISTLEELLEAKAMITAVQDALHRQAIPFQTDMPVGIMIEVPSAAIIVDQFAPQVSRLSIGTNDLVQYLMAADRTNSRVSNAADYFQPAVLRVIQTVVSAGRRSAIPVDICGEMAADPVAVPLLLGLGVRELSMSPSLIPGVKRVIASWTIADAEALARQALDAPTSLSVRQLLAEAAKDPKM